MNGMIAKRLLTRMKKNNVTRYGTNLMKSWLPMMSRAMRVAHEAVRLLTDVLQPAGDHRALAGGEEEEAEDQDRASTSCSIGLVTPM